MYTIYISTNIRRNYKMQVLVRYSGLFRKKNRQGETTVRFIIWEIIIWYLTNQKLVNYRVNISMAVDLYLYCHVCWPVVGWHYTNINQTYDKKGLQFSKRYHYYVISNFEHIYTPHKTKLRGYIVILMSVRSFFHSFVRPSVRPVFSSATPLIQLNTISCNVQDLFTTSWHIADIILNF